MHKLSLLITAAVLAAIGGYVAWHWDDFRQAATLTSPYMLVFTALGLLGSFLAGGLINVIMMRRLGAIISLNECIALGIMTSASNLLLPMRGGLAARAIYLKKVFQFSFADFATSVLGYYVLMFLVNSIAATLAVAVIATRQPSPGTTLVLLASLGCLAFSLFLLMIPRLPTEGPFFVRKAGQVVAGWHKIRSERRLVAQLVLVSLFEAFNFALALYGTYGALGIDLGALELVTISTLGALSFLIGVTPGGLGIYEAVVAFIGTTLGISATDSVASSLLYRLALVAVLLLAAPLSSYFLSKKAVA